MALQHLRSSTADKRPTPAAMSDGQLALNTNLVSPGLFFKDSNGDSVKIGPVHVGTTAPNVTPGAGGQAGNSKGEAWLDTTAANPILKVFNGSAFVAVQPVGTGTVVSTTDTGTVTSTMILDGTILNADINASAAIVDTKLATIATAGKVSNSATTATNANTASAIVARDASGNFSAGTITAALTGAASSNVLKAGDTMTGVLAVTAGTAALPAITPSGDPNTGIFSPGADQLAVATNGTQRLYIAADGSVGINTTTFATNSKLAIATAAGKFDICGDGGSSVRLINGGGITFDSASGHFFNQGASEFMRISSAGLVGIGTSSPQALLHITGGYAGFQYNSAGAYPAYNTYFGALGANFSNSGSELDIWNTIGSGFAFRKQTGASAQSCLMYISSAGNVGIGTTAPLRKLVISNSNAEGIETGPGESANLNLQLHYNRTSSAYVTNKIDAADHLFFNSATERVRIDSSGRLLVGTSSVINDYWLGGAQSIQSAKSSLNGILVYTATAFTPGHGSFLGLHRANGTIASPAIVANGDTLGAVYFGGYDGSTYPRSAAIDCVVDGTPGANDMPGRIVFSTTADGSASPTERMRINSSGNLLVGTTTDFPGEGNTAQGLMFENNGTLFQSRSTGGPAATFNINENSLCMRFNRSGTTVGSVSVTTTATAFNTSSDYRLKEAIAPMTGALAKVALLKPCTYKWKVNDSDGEGFIAHELQAVVPDCVTGEKDAVDSEGKPQYQGIDTSFLVATLTAAIQEQQALITALTARVAALEAN